MVRDRRPEQFKITSWTNPNKRPLMFFYLVVPSIATLQIGLECFFLVITSMVGNDELASHVPFVTRDCTRFPAPRPVLESLVHRYLSYSEPVPLRVAVGTYNINGGKHFRSIVYKDVSLSDWLLDAHKTVKESGKSESVNNAFVLGGDNVHVNHVNGNTNYLASLKWVTVLLRYLINCLCTSSSQCCLYIAPQLIRLIDIL